MGEGRRSSLDKKTKTMRLLLLALLAFATQTGLYAQRVVSLLPSATYTAKQIGADAAIVGRTSYCPQSGHSKVVGDAMTVSTEAIVALRPDAVIVSPYTQKGVVDKLHSLGIRTEDIPTPADFGEICRQAETIGEIVGRQTEARDAIQQEKLKVDSLQHSTQWTRGKKAYVQVGMRPLWGATPDYFISDMIERLGMTNVLLDGEGNCSREEVLRRAPDVFVISSMGGMGKSEAETWRELSGSRYVVVVDENVLCCPTPQFFRMAMEQICQSGRP